MEIYWKNLVLYSVMIGAAVVAGGVIPVFLIWTRKQLHFLLALSAGLMLGAALVHLLPSAFELIGRAATLWCVGGFLLLYLIEKFLTTHLCALLECEVHSMGIAAVIGISAHAFTDGVALGSGLLVSELGLIVFLTIFFHKLPEAFALTTILIHEKQGRGRILFFNLLLIAMIPAGALLVRFLSGLQGPGLTGIALAFSAGTFLHISLSDLLPHVHEHAQRRFPIVVCFLIGLAAMFLLDQFLGHEGLHH